MRAKGEKKGAAGLVAASRPQIRALACAAIFRASASVSVSGYSFHK